MLKSVRQRMQVSAFILMAMPQVAFYVLAGFLSGELRGRHRGQAPVSVSLSMKSEVDLTWTDI